MKMIFSYYYIIKNIKENKISLKFTYFLNCLIFILKS